MDRTRSISRVNAPRLGTIAIGLFSAAIVLFLVGRFVLRGDAPAPAPPVATTTQATGVAVRAAPKKSIAVLPFTDLSPEHDQEYFSDGMAEELMSALSRIKDLKVAGRTSSFSFRGKNEDLRQIGQALSVANVLEGSVRKQGDKVRITVQLVQASDGYHLWSETYDGDLGDVFELQERIARAITDQLQAILEGDQHQRLVPVATGKPEAYALYLQATTIYNRRNGPRFPEAIALLEDALRLDPGYARAHARLAAVYAVAPNYTPIGTDEAFAIAEREAHRAIELDPSLAEAHAVLGLLYGNRRQYLEGRAALEQAVALDPRDVTANFWLGINLVCVGYLAEGGARVERALEIDPLHPNALQWRSFVYLSSGDVDRARALTLQAVAGGLSYGELTLAEIAHAEGRDGDATAHFARGGPMILSALPKQAAADITQGVFGDADGRARALAAVDAYLATKPKVVSGAAPFLLLYLGDPARALAVAQAAPTGNDQLVFTHVWAPIGTAARKLPQFAEFARKVGLAAVWDKYGMPDLCTRRAPGDYVCE